MKTCSKCKENKVLKEYAKDKSKKSGYRPDCKLCVSKIASARYVRDRIKILKDSKSYYEEHKEQVSDRCGVYRNNNKVKIATYQKKYRNENKEEISKYLSSYRIKNKKKIAKYSKSCRKETSLKMKIRYTEDLLFKSTTNIRNLIRGSLKSKGFKKTSKTAQILGCSFEELHIHLRHSFESNYGIPFNHIDPKLLHIDHIVPLVTAKTEEEVLKLNHYTNLQYLFSWDNLEKADKLDWKLS